MTQIQLEQLKLQLRGFGLDPREWRLLPEAGTRVVLRHRRDRDFRLRGLCQLATEGWRWTELQLISL